MPYGLLVSLFGTIILLFFSLLFKVAGKLRLTIPLLYLLAAVVSTFFTDWTNQNEEYVLLGLYILVGLVAFSWVYSLVKAIRKKRWDRRYDTAFGEDVAWQIQRAGELGVPFGRVRVLEDGTVVHDDTGEPILPVACHGRRL